MAGPILSHHGPHHEAEELLPWYATGQLDESDRAKVTAHLSSCSRCQQQLALERQLIDEFQTMDPEVESGWARLRHRLQTPATAPLAAEPNRSKWFAEVCSFLGRPAIAALAAAQLAFVVIASVVLISLGQPAYHTLGTAQPPAGGNVIVMFRPDATEQDIRKALRSAGASLVDGPTPANAYLLHVAPARRPFVLNQLQSDDVVQLAQPIDGGGP